MKKEKPILFSGEMVKAILDGRKTQTRRFVKGDLREIFSGLRKAPYGSIGDRLWVRETWTPDCATVEECRASFEDLMPGCGGPYYRATASDFDIETLRWKPSIHMPRWASRINLKITAKRFEWLQHISKADCVAEGMTGLEDVHAGWHQSYAELWDKINGKPLKDGTDISWKANPMILVLTFDREG